MLKDMTFTQLSWIKAIIEIHIKRKRREEWKKTKKG